MLASILLAFPASAALPGPAKDKPIVRGEQGKELEALVEATAPGFWGAVLVAPRGEIVLARGYGIGKGNDKRAGADWYFDTGSISKTYTAVAVLRLAQDGKLALDDPLSKWIPAAPGDKAAITLRQLLQHASGFSRAAAGWKVEDYDSRDQALAAILAQPLVHAPGAEFDYSNVNYTLLAAVIELASGAKFEEYLARSVFDACELESTSFAGWSGRKLERKRGTERIDGGMRGHVADYPWGWGKRGVTNVVASVLDLHRFAQALRAGELLDQERRELLFTAGVGDYTCGLELFEGPGGRRTFGHRGSTNGYGGVFWLDREDGTTIVVLTREQGVAVAVCTALASAVTKEQEPAAGR